MDENALKDGYPRLYDLCFDHNIIVAETIDKGWWASDLEEFFMKRPGICGVT